MKSLWSQTINLQKTKKLEEDIRVQNVVIGAGMAGILIAYFLQENGRDVIVLEADEMASGQTKNTTAKITSQHGLMYHNLINSVGLEKAKIYANANESAIRQYKKIITKEGISCDYKELPSFLYTQKEEGVEKLKKEAKAARRCGVEVEYVRGDQIKELPFGIAGAVRFDNQAQFHPLKFIQGLTKKLTIYEHTKVIEVDEHFVITERNVIVAENVIFATHYPFLIRPGYYFLRQHQSRSYALALEGEVVPKQLKGMYYGIDRDGLSFRSADEKLIVGGASHRTGKDFYVEINGAKKKKEEPVSYLRRKINMYYPEAKEIAVWAAQDCMPHDGIPFIGKLSIKHDNWYVATGFHKWGMTSAMVSAMIICDEITGKENPWSSLFCPQRILLKAGWKAFLMDGLESARGLIAGLFKKKTHRCGHMGCRMYWNETEQSWDCPCHGSRYEKNGKILDGPAQKDLE